MRAKIMLLSSTWRDEQNARYALRILTDISAAFNHTLSVLQDKIGEKSQKAYGEALSDKVISACQDCQAVFVCDGACPGLDELYDALDIPLTLRSLSVPEALCDRGESPVSLYVGTVLSLDEETLRRALRQAFLIAQEADMLLRHTAPSGASRDVWNAAVRLQETLLPQVSTVAQTAPEAVREMILSPQRAGFVLCPPYAGSILLAAGTALCAHPGVIHDMALGEGADVYAAWLPENDETILPFSAALAAAKLLRYSLHLPRESACVEAAVSNVISSGLKHGDGTDADIDEMLDLICEQITVAGELMQRGGLG